MQTNMKESKKENIRQNEENIIYGRHPVQEALNSGRPLDKVILRKGIAVDFQKKIKKATARCGVPFTLADNSTLDRICGGANHQGIVARLSHRKYDTLEDIFVQAEKKGEDPFILILNQVQDPHNLGSLIRTALGAGVHGVVIPRHRSARLSPTVSKTSAGADSYMPVAMVTNIADTIEKLKDKGISTIGACSEAKNSIFKYDFSGPVALILGGEDSGLGSRVKKMCDDLVKIPLSGEISSLNVSVAGAILLFKIREHR